MMIRVVLCGTRSFGRAILSLLLTKGYVEVVAVSAPAPSPDRPDDKLWGRAGDVGIPRIPSGRLRHGTMPSGVDLIVAAHSHDVIGRRTRDKAALGAIGYHPSLLPLHRGRDAVRWTIHDRDRVAGGSVYWFTDAIDAGPIAAQDWCLVRPGDDAEALWRRDLFPMGVSLISKALDDLSRGSIVRIPQDHSLATWEPSWERPPLFRPDLPELGDGGWRGYRVVTERPIACSGDAVSHHAAEPGES
jgi:methionyl-tRNA formyltransferase